MTCSMSVVLPEDSGPKISTTRPLGKPPPPNARSRPRAPVGMTSIFTCACAAPRRMMLPSPYALVMDEMAASSSRWRAALAFSFSAARFSAGAGAAFSVIFDAIITCDFALVITGYISQVNDGVGHMVQIGQIGQIAD